MKQSSKCAIGGIVAALSLVLMISVAIIPFLTYALPAIAGVFIIFVALEIDKKWACGVYTTVAILSMFLVPDKEVAVMYLAFFGYYPILKLSLESHFNKVLSWILKIFTFIASMLISYLFMIKLMGITVDELDEFGLWAIPMLLGLGTFAFIMYDIVLSRLMLIYRHRWSKLFKKHFK